MYVNCIVGIFFPNRGVSIEKSKNCYSFLINVRYEELLIFYAFINPFGGEREWPLVDSFCVEPLPSFFKDFKNDRQMKMRCY